MIKTEKLFSDDNADMIRVLEYIKSKHNVGVGSIQRACELGYARVVRYVDRLTEAGVIENPHTYRMVLGDDGKRHRQYTPNKLVATDEELCACIDALKEKL